MSIVKKNGVVNKLPPGFRFHPTDEELVVHYLKRKVYSSPLPASVIFDVDVCKSDPWDLPGELGKERYFFSTKEAKYPNGNRSNRATVSGYWKATGKDKPIFAAAPRNLNLNPNPPVIGMKKTLVFYRGKPPHGNRTDWIMHEYRLVDTPPQKTREATGGGGDWVLCRIFLKKRGNANANAGTKNEHEHDKEQGVVCQELDVLDDADINDDTMTRRRKESPVFYDFLARERADLNLPAPCSSSSGSSDVTQLSPRDDDDDHINHGNNNNNHREQADNYELSSSSEEHDESSSCCYSFSSSLSGKL